MSWPSSVPPFIASFTEAEIAAAAGAVTEILRGGQLILGAHTETFETTFASLTGTRYGVAVNSGSTALEIIFRSLAVEGRTVLVPANTNFATAAAAVAAGARVQLYDCGLYPDVADLERKLTPEVAAVVVVHIGGYISPELPAIARHCERLAVPLVEDAAHAHGSTLDGHPAGAFGYAAAFSFYPTKVITCGEGGMITTSDARLDQAARSYRDQGKSADGRHHLVMGNSWRMTETGAALGQAQMDTFSADRARRRTIIDRYQAALDGAGLWFPHVAAGSQVSGHKCVAVLSAGINRAQLRDVLARRGVRLGRGVYECPLHRQPVFAHLNTGPGFPAADGFADWHICLPLWRHMDDTAVQQVIGALTAALRAAG